MLERPPTQIMIHTLMECHEREVLQLEPLEASMVSSGSGLVSQGLIMVKAFTNAHGKKIVGVYLTNAGLALLKKVSK